jgi:beta-glucosidase
MSKRTRISQLFLCVLFLSWAHTVAGQDPVRNFEKGIDSLISLMTLEEKVGQMTQYSSFWDFTGPAPEEGYAKGLYDQIKKGLVGSMLNARGAEQVRSIQEMVMEHSRLRIPMVFALDVIHGHRTVTPIPLAEAASWDLEAIEAGARLGAVEASAAGINWTFAPMVDISRDARWGRVMEGGGEDPYLGSRIAEARVKGYQGDDLSAHNTIAACAKHLAGYGFTEAGKEYNTVDIGTYTLYNVVLPPFKAAADAGVRTMMNSFNTLNGIPATGDKFLQRDVVKNGWDFDGFIVSDWASGSQMQEHGFARDLKHAAELAANAGSDMDMQSYAYPRHLKELVEEGKVPMEVVDDAVRRILRVKFELGLFDDPYRYCDPEREQKLLYSEEHLATALDIAKKSIVLLKNEEKMLPLDKNLDDLLVIGVLAGEKNSPLGNWRFGSIDSSGVSVIEGLEALDIPFNYVRGPELVEGSFAFAGKVNINTTDRAGFDEAVEAAKSAKKIVMVLGEHGFQSGESRSRTNLDLPGLQKELLQAVYAVNPNIVLVLMNGRPLTLTWEDEHIPAILEAWQLGSMSGHAIASVLFGDYNPSGKLPMSFPRSVGQIPIYYNHFNTGRPSSKSNDIFYSRYMDVENSPLYPFGYGLSYTSFKYSDLDVKQTGENRVEVRISVKNTGDLPGEEVVQLYIRDYIASLVRPVKELKGFEKIHLEPGESKRLSFTLTENELGFYTGNGDFICEPGTFQIMVGTNSQELTTTYFDLE